MVVLCLQSASLHGTSPHGQLFHYMHAGAPWTCSRRCRLARPRTMLTELAELQRQAPAERGGKMPPPLPLLRCTFWQAVANLPISFFGALPLCRILHTQSSLLLFQAAGSMSLLPHALAALISSPNANLPCYY